MSDFKESASKMSVEYFGVTPLPGVEYPITMEYCGNCTMPIEYCEFYPSYDKCKAWLEKNLPDMFEKLMSTKDGGSSGGGGGGGAPANPSANESGGGGAAGDGSFDGDDEKKRQKRGGKGMVRLKKKDDSPKKVVVFTAPRGRKKLTVVTGLKTFDLDLKVCSKAFGQKFACGSSVTAPDEIVIQGDIKDEIIDFILEKWPQIDDDSVEDGGEHKR